MKNAVGWFLFGFGLTVLLGVWTSAALDYYRHRQASPMSGPSAVLRNQAHAIGSQFWSLKCDADRREKDDYCWAYIAEPPNGYTWYSEHGPTEEAAVTEVVKSIRKHPIRQVLDREYSGH